jgi:single-stranded-DNA-specific exonuclease
VNDILIYGDYDVDGTTSVALVLFVFEQIVPQHRFLYSQPIRRGLRGVVSRVSIMLPKHNCSLVIALDCGIKAVEKVDYAKKKQIDFIICDHHTPGDTLARSGGLP